MKKSSLMYGILVCSFLLSCTGNSNNTKEQTTEEADPVTEIETIPSVDAFLEEHEGTWVCYKYEPFYAAPPDEDFAKEFSSYAYFIIRDNIVSAQGIYNSEFYSYNYPVGFQTFNTETLLITQFSISTDSAQFIAPKTPYSNPGNGMEGYPYYKDAPMNSTQLFLDDNFIILYEGYVYFFRKGEIRETEENENYGVPGDQGNIFRVTKYYITSSVREALEQFEADHPYGAKHLLYSCSNPELIINHDWDIDPELRLESDFPDGKFVLLIEKTNQYIKLEYYNFYGYTENPEYEG